MTHTELLKQLITRELYIKAVENHLAKLPSRKRRLEWICSQGENPNLDEASLFMLVCLCLHLYCGLDLCPRDDVAPEVMYPIECVRAQLEQEWEANFQLMDDPLF